MLENKCPLLFNCSRGGRGVKNHARSLAACDVYNEELKGTK